MAELENKLYPNCDMSVFLRTCEDEVIKPIIGKVTGEIPEWLSGNLLRNGPGAVQVGTMRYEHIFDCLALLHRFAIKDGSVTYQCRFLQSHTYKRNKKANRIVVTDFATKGVPDPCHTIFDRIATRFDPSDILSDNALISIYPFGDEVYAFTESPILTKIDPETLETTGRKNLINHLIVTHTSHPHVMPNGDVYNMGVAVKMGNLCNVIVKFPHGQKGEKGSMVDEAQIVGSTYLRWFMYPAYMHSFGITENYFVMIEHPMIVSVPNVAWSRLANEPLAPCIKWYPEYETHIVLISRETGKEFKRFRTDTIFFMHTINTFEQDGKVIVDLCTYKDAKILDSLYIHAMETSQSNEDYPDWFRSRPTRIEVSLDAPDLSKVEAKPIVELCCEVPRINYDFNARPYRYFYAISTDVEVQHFSMIIKVDTVTREVKTWREPNCFPSEPIFVPAPNSKDEDDGVILSALLWNNGRECEVALLVLDAKTMEEKGRAHFHTPSPTPKCFHGWFLPQNKTL